MKVIKSDNRNNRDKRDTLHVTRYILMVLRSYGLMVFFLSAFLLFCFSTLHAQTVENIILDSVFLQKNELIVTPEIEEKMVTHIKNLPEEAYSDYGIKDKAQLENLQIGKPVPLYSIVNEQLEPIRTYNVSRMADGAPLSLYFTNTWNVPVMSEDEPLLFGAFELTT